MSFELRVGADFLARKDQILGLFRSRTVPLDLTAALRAGEVASTLQASGTGIGFADCMQAGICLRYGLPLATRNRKHFDGSRGCSSSTSRPPDGSANARLNFVGQRSGDPAQPDVAIAGALSVGPA